MTCATIRDTMLEAELDELRGQGDSAVAVHVRQCLPCRSVGAQLVLETERLAVAVRRRPVAASPRAERRHGLGSVGAAATLVGIAATVVIVVTRNAAPAPESAPVIALQPVIATATAPNVPAPARLGSRRARPRTAIPTLRRAPAEAAVRAMPFTAQQTAAVPAGRAVAVAPVRFDPAPPPEPLGSGVSVDVPAGKEATILRTDRPDVTVVWIYSSRTQP